MNLYGKKWMCNNYDIIMIRFTLAIAITINNHNNSYNYQ